MFVNFYGVPDSLGVYWRHTNSFGAVRDLMVVYLRGAKSFKGVPGFLDVYLKHISNFEGVRDIMIVYLRGAKSNPVSRGCQASLMFI